MKRSGVFLVLLLMASGLGAGLPATFAQPYPNRPIQLIIPNVPGAIVDINARALAEELGKILGTQIVPLNKPGAGTSGPVWLQVTHGGTTFWVPCYQN